MQDLQLSHFLPGFLTWSQTANRNYSNPSSSAHWNSHYNGEVTIAALHISPALQSSSISAMLTVEPEGRKKSCTVNRDYPEQNTATCKHSGSRAASFTSPTWLMQYLQRQSCGSVHQLCVGYRESVCCRQVLAITLRATMTEQLDQMKFRFAPAQAEF